MTCIYIYIGLINVCPNHPFLEIVYENLTKLSKKLFTFSFSHKKFPEMVS